MFLILLTTKISPVRIYDDLHITKICDDLHNTHTHTQDVPNLSYEYDCGFITKSPFALVFTYTFILEDFRLCYEITLIDLVASTSHANITFLLFRLLSPYHIHWAEDVLT